RPSSEAMIAPSKIQKIVLVASSTICLVAALYGDSPYWFGSAVLGTSEPYPNLAHCLRAMICIGFGFYWFFAAVNAKYRNPALLTITLFPAGLVPGRIIIHSRRWRTLSPSAFYMVTELI